jgi:AcrR family transcriptional regulator
MAARSERKDAAEHRRLILNTAETLFDEFGVQSVSMHQIARCAGVGQGTLYRRYAHKGDLCLDIIQHLSQEFMAYIDDYLQEHKAVAAEERLGWVMDYWVDMIEKNAGLIMTIEAHQLKGAEENKATTFFASPLYRFLRERMSELLAEISEGTPEIAADPTLTAHALICALAPHGHFHMKREQGFTTEQLKNNYRRMCRLPDTPIP